jgi:ADP-L-glycero-D-manno-heptose 6-epimerase
MIIVTGGLGFIGSNLIKRLNTEGRFDICIIDDFKNGKLIENINDLVISDFIQIEQAEEYLKDNIKDIEVIFHLGAISDTMCWDGELIVRKNFSFSKMLAKYSKKYEIKLIYASSASVYGIQTVFEEVPQYERPINMYAYSKLLFDQYLRNNGYLNDANLNIHGLRYFNVYGPREYLKGKMASPIFKISNQIINNGNATLFGKYDNYKAGEQKRDFVFIRDIVDVNIWLWKNQILSGVLNIGTGSSVSFNNVANSVLKALSAFGYSGHIQYIDFPEGLIGSYQSYTQAELSKLRQLGYDKRFLTIEEGIELYFQDEKSGLVLQ